MRFHFLRSATLASFLALACFSSAQAAEQREYQVVQDAAWDSDSATTYDDIEQVQYLSTGNLASNGLGLSLGLGNTIKCQRCQVFAYGDYIYARACASENVAYILADPNNVALNGVTIVEHDMDYTSSYRFGGGIANVCGGAIVFNYANYRSTSDFSVTDTSTATTTSLFGQYEVNAPADGGVLSGDSEAEIQSYDLGFARTWPLCACMPCCDPCCDDCCGGCDDTCCDTCCGNGCDGCGDGCGCCKPCPAWDITWSAAVRFADVGWNRGALATDSTGTDQIDSFRTTLSFKGVGARTGLMGRRYIGQSRILSIYAKGDISLLAGDMNISTITTDDPDGTDTGPLVAGSHQASGCRIIPVTEIEAGLTTQLTSNCQFSAGYFLSAWHDLGFRDEYNWTVPGLQISHYDDANILGFDGFFARAMVAF